MAALFITPGRLKLDIHGHVPPEQTANPAALCAKMTHCKRKEKKI
jgi:hypothetical protein